jgi:hypothetical protein
LGRPLLSSLAFTTLRSSTKIAYAYFLYDKKNAHNGIYQAAGISGATSQSDRRTGLTNLAERVRTLMALAGYSQLAITKKYLDLRPSVASCD